MQPAVFTSVTKKRKSAFQHNNLMSYHTVVHVSVRKKHHQALGWKTI